MRLSQPGGNPTAHDLSPSWRCTPDGMQGPGLGRVKGRTREGKQRGGMGNRIPLDPHAAQEFILDLHQVARVKEGGATRKERVSYLIRMGMKGMRLTQGLEFFVRHDRLLRRKRSSFEYTHFLAYCQGKDKDVS